MQKGRLEYKLIPPSCVLHTNIRFPFSNYCFKATLQIFLWNLLPNNVNRELENCNVVRVIFLMGWKKFPTFFAQSVLHGINSKSSCFSFLTIFVYGFIPPTCKRFMLQLMLTEVGEKKQKSVDSTRSDIVFALSAAFLKELCFILPFQLFPLKPFPV